MKQIYSAPTYKEFVVALTSRIADASQNVSTEGLNVDDYTWEE